MARKVVIKAAVNCLIHVPDLVRHGSKPRREIEKEPSVLEKIQSRLRTYKEAVLYPPNQAFIGNIRPQELAEIARPWYRFKEGEMRPNGKFGEITNQSTFYTFLKEADVKGFFDTKEKIKKIDNLPIFDGNTLIGYMNRDNSAEGAEDEDLKAHHILEALCAKASGALAMKRLFRQTGRKPEEFQYILSCGEEALGDRYQRGGGGLAKAIAHMSGCINATGDDVKNFCAAPVSAIIMAGAFVKAGIFDDVIVVGGGSLAKLGMKFKSFVQEGIPILDDCLGAIAILVSKDNGISPVIELKKGAIGIHPVSAGAVDSVVYDHVIRRPLKKLKLKMTGKEEIEIEFAPELQNSEIMERAGAGDVATKNFRKIADQAVEEMIENKEIDPDDDDAIEDFIDAFTKKISMPGFAPTQGHIPSAVPYLPFAIEDLKNGQNKRVMFVGKASLFLNRLIEALDARSFVLKKNPAQK